MKRAAALLAAWTLAAPAAPAVAQSGGFEPLRWLGIGRPQPRADALPYEVTVTGADGALAGAARDVSLLVQLRDEPPLTGDELARRIEADLPRVTDALWAQGYYAAAVTIRIDAAAAAIGAPNTARLAAAAERQRNLSVVPVTIAIEPGPVYRLERPSVVDARTGRPFDPETVPERVVGIRGGEPAATATVLAAASRLSDRFRERGHPFVKVKRRQPVIDHRTQAVDLDLTVDPGPVATLGRITVTGTEAVHPAVVRSFIYAEPGDPYSPDAIAAIRRSVARIEALGGVRVREGEALDRNGGLPLEVAVTERPPRLVGGSLRYSTVDGPAVKAYWAHRNLFGGAERLRIDADLFYTRLDRDENERDVLGRKRGFEWRDLGGRLSASFLKPALYGSRFDLLADAAVTRERTEAYDADFGLAQIAIRRRFTDTISAQIGIEGEIGRTELAPAPLAPRLLPNPKVEYGLLGLPVSLAYDDTDRPLDPTRGLRITASAAPYAGFRDAPPAFGIGRVNASAYFAFDADGRYVLAARGGFGTILGGRLDEIPATRRFFAGGGGSVRGFEYRSLSPRDRFGRLVGGKSLVEGSLEARLRFTETIGLVPFVDVGQAFAGAFPDGSERLRVGAGLGLRYYTSLGPIRVDVAVPLNRRQGESTYAIYVGIGQAF